MNKAQLEADNRRQEALNPLIDELKAIASKGEWTNRATELVHEIRALVYMLGTEEREDAKLGDLAFITLKNGTHVPLKDGVAIGGPLKGQDFSEAKSSSDPVKEKPKRAPSPNYSSPYPIEEISAEGENKPCKGFTLSCLQRHKRERHAEQYASMTDEEYNEHAKRLLQKKCGPDIWGYRCDDGCVCRFNRLTGEYAKGYPGGDIKTCFYPTAPGSDPVEIDLDYARDYFRKWKEKEAYD